MKNTPIARVRVVPAVALVLVLASSLFAESPPVLWNHLAGDRHYAGYKDGPAAEALFNSPQGLDVDSEGNIYVADQGNSVVRKITPDGMVSTIAGKAGEGGLVDGPAASARFASLINLTVAHDGSIYVIDSVWLRRISPTGFVSTIGGTRGAGYSLSNLGETAPALSTFMFSSNGVAVDRDLNVFVAANTNILKVTPEGIASVWVNRSTPGVDHGASLVKDLQVGADGYLYFGIPMDGVVYRISPDGVGEQVGPPQYSIPFQYTWFDGIAVQPDGKIWLAQPSSRLVTTVTANRDIEIVNASGSREEYSGRFLYPNGLAPAPDGGVYLTDSATHSVQHLAADGTSTVVAGMGIQPVADGTRQQAGFAYASSLSAVHGNTVFISDAKRIRSIDLRTGQVTTVLETADTLYADQFFGDVDVDQMGNLYLGNFPENCVSKLSPSGELKILAGSPDEEGVIDGAGTTARFINPRHLVVSPSGTCYVIDNNGGYAVRAISPEGIVTTIAGSSSANGYVDGPGTEARFVFPRSMGIAPDGSIWVADNVWMRRITADGNVETLTGGNTEYPPPDGVGTEVGFSAVMDIAFSPDGVAIVAEVNPGRLREVHSDGTVRSLQITGVYAPDSRGAAVSSLAIAPDGTLFAADSANHRVLTGMLTPDAGRLANLSVLKRVGDGGSKLTVGFVTEGTAPKSTLVRAIGPTLANHGIPSGFMPDPLLELFDRDGERVETSDDWSDANDLIDTTQRLGAVPLAAGTADAAVVREIPNGPFTATASSADGRAGQVLVEVYDADLTGATRLTNVSTLTQVTPGDGRLIAGFVITGEGQKTVLIRGVGPSLSAFGIPASQVLPDPRIRLFGAGGLVAENDDWAGAPLLDAAFNAVGAFAFADEHTADAALLLKLDAGNYSVHLESADGASGQAIIEVYEVK